MRKRVVTEIIRNACLDYDPVDEVVTLNATKIAELEFEIYRDGAKFEYGLSVKKILPISANQVHRSFVFGGVHIGVEDIEIVRRQEWLNAAHIRFFCLYLQAKISAAGSSWKPYLFSPLGLEDIQAGWEHIYSQQDQESAKGISTSDYLIFPVTTTDHWFLIIVSWSKELCGGEQSSIYVLDSKGNDWDEVREDMSKVMCGAAKTVNPNETSSKIAFYQASPDMLPQQSDELCGFYLLAYLEIFARDPHILLKQIREGRAIWEDLKPGSLDHVLPVRFLGLLEEFQNAEKRSGILINNNGQPIIQRDLRAVLSDC
ncbi:hypothetical protein BDW69DRAFT_100915 [Aspergillus filifer]